MKCFSLILILFFQCQIAFSQEDALSLYFDAKEAYEAKDYKKFLAYMFLTDEALPNQTSITIDLAKAYALNGRRSKSVQQLKKLMQLDANYDFQNDVDLHSIRGHKGYREVVNLQRLLLVPEANDEVFRTIKIDSNQIEGFVILEDGNILLGSVNHKKIIKVDKTGKTTDWLELPYSVLGMKIDNRTGNLWVTTAVTKQMEGFKQPNMGKSMVFQIDTATRIIQQGIEFNDGELFGDLELDKDSKLWLSNSMRPYLSRDITDTSLYMGAFVRKQLDLSATHFNLQGLSLDDDETSLYFADYYSGIYKINISTDEIIKIQFSKDFLPVGIDGLYYYNNSLIAIHNGVKPYKVIRYFLDDKGENIIGRHYINRGGETLKVPTLGQIKDGYFYYISNSSRPENIENIENFVRINKSNTVEIRRYKLR